MQPRTARSRKVQFFNWMAPVILSLLLIALIPPAPSFATSFSGSASLDWSALTMTGIDFTASSFRQDVSATVQSRTGFDSDSKADNAWHPATVSASVPSVGSSSGTITDTSLSASGSVFFDQALASGSAARGETITAQTDGLLTVSIPFQIQSLGPSSGELFANPIVSLSFINPNFTGGGITDGAFGQSKTGILSLSIPFTQGQTGILNFDTRVITFVPGPETFWPFALGFVLLAVFLYKQSRQCGSRGA